MKKKVKINFSNILIIVFVIASIYLIRSILLFNKIENLLRYIIVGIICIIDILLLIKMFFHKKKRKKRIVLSILLILFSSLFIYLGFNLNKIYSYFSGLNKKVVYSTSLVTLKENESTDLSKLKDMKIGISSENDSQNLSKDIIDKYSLDKNNKIINYEDYSQLILDLYDKKVDYIFLPTNYIDIFGTREEFEDIGERVVTIDTTKKEVEKEEVHLSGSSKDVSEPFTILLIGIDSTIDGLQGADSFNGDSLILVTFNPTNMSATMLSIPRDSYVPITCWANKPENKITHAAANSTRCVINTIQNFLDVKIDYYMKINFTGVVDLVNAVGGIEVDVPFKICEQDSKRRFGDHTVYIDAGHQKLNGEQALAFARNRKNNAQYCPAVWTQGYRSDFVRSENQQTVIQAILNKMKSFRNINELKEILKIISKNFDTNMSEETLFSFYNIAKDVMISSSSDSIISIQKLYLDGTGQMIYDERSGLVMWDYILNQKSLSAVKTAMKNNLNGTKQELIKTFSYKIGENYEPTVVGKGYSGTEKYRLLSDLVGMKLTAAESWAQNNGITLKVEYVSDDTKDNDVIIEQNYPENKRLDLISDKTVTVKVVKNETVPTITKVDCITDSENNACILPDLIGKTKDDFLVWANKFSNVVDISFVKEESDEKENTILKQSIEKGTTVKEIIENKETITITLATPKAQNNNENNNNEGENGNENNNGNENSNGENTGNENNGGNNNNEGNENNNNENNSGNENQNTEEGNG